MQVNYENTLHISQMPKWNLLLKQKTRANIKESVLKFMCTIFALKESNHAISHRSLQHTHTHALPSPPSTAVLLANNQYPIRATKSFIFKPEGFGVENKKFYYQKSKCEVNWKLERKCEKKILIKLQSSGKGEEQQCKSVYLLD